MGKNNRVKSSKDAAKYRNELLKKQNDIDPVINKKITKPVLDHQHFGEQRCRAVLQLEVNSFEGKVYNAYVRYIKHLTDEELPDILRRLALYLENDYSGNKIHHTALTVDVKKFKTFPAKEQCDILESFGVEPDSNNHKRGNQIRKLIKNGDFDMYTYLQTKKDG